MKLKAILIAISSLAVIIVKSQTGYFIESNVEYPGIFKPKNAKTSVYTKGNDMKMEVITKSDTRIHYYVGDTVCLIDKYNGENTYAKGTREEMKALNKENKVIFKDVVIEKTTKTEKLLDYECKIVKIKYTVTTMGFDVKTECTAWYTDKLDMNIDVTGDADSFGEKNELTDAMKSLGGVILKQETRINGMLMGTVTVNKIEKRESIDADLVVDTKGLGKAITLKKFRDKMAQRDAKQQQQMNSMKGF